MALSLFIGSCDPSLWPLQSKIQFEILILSGFAKSRIPAEAMAYPQITQIVADG